MIKTIMHWMFMYGIEVMLFLLLTVCIAYVIKLLVEEPLKGKFVQIKHRSRLRHTRTRQKIRELQKRSPLLQHIYYLLQAASPHKKRYDITAFVMVTLLIFATVFVLMLVNLKDIILGIVIAGLASLVPYIILHIRLRRIQNAISNQLTSIVEELTQLYSACGHNMYRTLIEASKKMKHKDLRAVFMRLVSDLQTVGQESEYRHAIDVFIYSCGQNNFWAKRLGNIILKAYLYDEDVLKALNTLSEQMESMEKVIEQEKSAAFEATVKGFAALPIFIASLFLGHLLSGPQDWITLQFKQAWSLVLFILALTLSILSFFIALLIRNPKNDF